jgi:hypothetical protein
MAVKLFDLIALATAFQRPGYGELPNPGFRLTPSEAQRAIDEMRESPKALVRPLVVIGGIFDPFRARVLAHFFGGITRGSKIRSINVGFCQSFERCRQRTIATVDKTFPGGDADFTTEVDVVGMSLGGLVGRFCAAPSRDLGRPRRLKIRRLFSISSPHAGAKVANLISLTEYHREFRPGSDFLNRLAAHDTLAEYEVYPYVLIDDDVVGEKFAAPPGKDPHWLGNASFLRPHLAAMTDQRILADISRRLRGEEPFSVARPLPRPVMGKENFAADDKSDEHRPGDRGEEVTR